MASESSVHHQALAEYVTEHRAELEAYAGSSKETATLAKALLSWDREQAAPQEGHR